MFQSQKEMTIFETLMKMEHTLLQIGQLLKVSRAELHDIYGIFLWDTVFHYNSQLMHIKTT